MKKLPKIYSLFSLFSHPLLRQHPNASRSAARVHAGWRDAAAQRCGARAHSSSVWSCPPTVGDSHRHLYTTRPYSRSCAGSAVRPACQLRRRRERKAMLRRRGGSGACETGDRVRSDPAGPAHANPFGHLPAASLCLHAENVVSHRPLPCIPFQARDHGTLHGQLGAGHLLSDGLCDFLQRPGCQLLV